jgi:hypothetical protein
MNQHSFWIQVYTFLFVRQYVTGLHRLSSHGGVVLMSCSLVVFVVKVFVEGVVSAGYNAPFFMSRFRECVKHFSTMFDSVEGSLPPDDPDRVLLEQECFGKEILNIVACEGLERVERAEPYRQWQSRTQRAGFTQRPLNPTIMSKMKAMMGSYPKEFGIGEDGGWILTGWKNHIIYGLSSWEPNLVATTIP